MHSLSVIDSLVSFLDSTGTLGAVNFLGLCWVDCSGANQMWGMWSDYVMLADNVMCQTLLCKREKESGAWSDFHLLQGFCMYIVFAYVHAYLVILWLSFQEDTIVRVQLKAYRWGFLEYKCTGWAILQYYCDNVILRVATILLAHDPLSSLAYSMITHTPLVAGNLPIKTLVARQQPTILDNANFWEYRIIAVPIISLLLSGYTVFSKISTY